MTSRHVALLRGINVGGKNVITMAALRACFEDHGFEDVTTLIQSGNVVFSSRGSARGELTLRIEAMLSEAFDYHASVMVRSSAQMHDIVARAPEGFGSAPTRYRYDVLFLRDSLTPATALENVTTKAGVDRVWPGKTVLYFSRRIAKATQSQLSKLVSRPIYQSITIRNWNTTTKLLALMSAAKA